MTRIRVTRQEGLLQPPMSRHPSSETRFSANRATRHGRPVSAPKPTQLLKEWVVVGKTMHDTQADVPSA
ncbi:hypothetical protein AXD71_14885 [Listeria monocytogenes]|nr:hypothetical protein AXD71_14885 [Listeria monocytogenes]